MHIDLVEFDKAQYGPGEDVNVSILVSAGHDDLATPGADGGGLGLAPTLTLAVRDVVDPVYVQAVKLSPAEMLGGEPVKLTLPAPILAERLGWEGRATKAKGFGVDIALAANDRVIARASTGFDIAQHWSFAPRYGFVSEYRPSDQRDVLFDKWRMMKSFHLNVVQFYDWMYRHHDFIPREPVFIDPLGRTIDIGSVKSQVELARSLGIRPMAYGAMYGAEKDFADSHLEWVAYTRDGRAHALANLIFIMDISQGSGWNEHIMGEYRRAMNEVGFSGIHVDQYGFPKTYYRMTRDLIRTSREFAPFIRMCRDRLGSSADIIFNCVNNWPMDEMAEAPQDVLYIEVWPPHNTYRDLRDLVLAAQSLSSHRKQVILAAYLAPFRLENDVPLPHAETAMRLASAAIMTSGGFHLVLGEGASALTDAYYPYFRQLRPGFAAVIKRYWDFAVRYEEFMFDLDARDVSQVASGGVNDELVIEGYPFGPGGNPGMLWTTVREGQGYKLLHLVNLVGIEDASWNSPKERPPKTLTNVKVRWLIDEGVRDVLYASPDQCDISCVCLSYARVSHPHGHAIEFVLPCVEYWSTVLVRLGQGSAL